MKQFLFSTILIAGLVYSIMAAWLYFNQRDLMYHPDTSRPSPGAAGLRDFEVVTYPTADGLELYAWYRAAENGKPTLVYFHGNAGNLLNHAWVAGPLSDAGYGVLVVEYRGYGGNPGKPTEAGLMADGRGAVAYLKSLGLAEADMVFYGISLGTGVAVAMAAETSPRALLLQSPFTSIADAGQHHYWYMPVKWLTKDKFDSEAIIAKINAPVLVIYSPADRVIPGALSLALFDAANEPKNLVIIKDAGHNDLADNGGLDAVLEFLNTLKP